MFRASTTSNPDCDAYGPPRRTRPYRRGSRRTAGREIVEAPFAGSENRHSTLATREAYSSRESLHPRRYRGIPYPALFVEPRTSASPRGSRPRLQVERCGQSRMSCRHAGSRPRQSKQQAGTNVTPLTAARQTSRLAFVRSSRTTPEFGGPRARPLRIRRPFDAVDQLRGQSQPIGRIERERIVGNAAEPWHEAIVASLDQRRKPATRQAPRLRSYARYVMYTRPPSFSIALRMRRLLSSTSDASAPRYPRRSASAQVR
jgi:hypothetical protein